MVLKLNFFAPKNNQDPTLADETSFEDDSRSYMSVIDHLDELRARLITIIIYLVIAFIVSLFFTKPVLKLLEAPAGHITFQSLSIEEPLFVFFKITFYLALAITAPLILGQIYLFIKPGLTKNERKMVQPLLIGSPLLFYMGVYFAYTCLLPAMLHFFLNFGQGICPINQRLDFYISLTTSILFYLGLCFQLPIVLFVLSLAKVVNSTMLLKVWRYAIFAATIVSAIITPDPTAFSMLIVLTALSSLYFFSILLIKLFGN